MNHVARDVLRGYDIYERTGFPYSMTIPGRDAASQVVDDFLELDRFVDLVQALARISYRGISGRSYRITGLSELISAVESHGYRFDRETLTFREDTMVQKTKNWGVLEEGETYVFSLVRVDVVDNSRLVRSYPEDVIERTYADLRRIFQEVIEFRDGRVWNWEGDGATAAFRGAATQLPATLSAISLLHELFFYNTLSRSLAEDLRIRVAVHNGWLQYANRFESISGSDLDKLVEIESKHCEPQSVFVSETVYNGLTNEVAEWLSPTGNPAIPLYRYRLEFEGGR
ncbi:MAG: hypothetical protein ACLFM0_02345 [Spirochaetales bacterium]